MLGSWLKETSKFKLLCGQDNLKLIQAAGVPRRQKCMVGRTIECDVEYANQECHLVETRHSFITTSITKSLQEYCPVTWWHNFPYHLGGISNFSQQ